MNAAVIVTGSFAMQIAIHVKVTHSYIYTPPIDFLKVTDKQVLCFIFLILWFVFCNTIVEIFSKRHAHTFVGRGTVPPQPPSPTLGPPLESQKRQTPSENFGENLGNLGPKNAISRTKTHPPAKISPISDPLLSPDPI